MNNSTFPPSVETVHHWYSTRNNISSSNNINFVCFKKCTKTVCKVFTYRYDSFPFRHILIIYIIIHFLTLFPSSRCTVSHRSMLLLVLVVDNWWKSTLLLVLVHPLDFLSCFQWRCFLLGCPETWMNPSCLPQAAGFQCQRKQSSRASPRHHTAGRVFSSVYASFFFLPPDISLIHRPETFQFCFRTSIHPFS